MVPDDQQPFLRTLPTPAECHWRYTLSEIFFRPRRNLPERSGGVGIRFSLSFSVSFDVGKCDAKKSKFSRTFPVSAREWDFV